MGAKTDLIDGIADGVHVLPLLPQLPSVLLDQAHHHAAASLVVVRVVVLLVQFDHKLRVHPECLCRCGADRKAENEGKRLA